MIGVPTTRAATTRYVDATENSGRASSPLSPTPIATTTPISTMSTASETTAARGETPPVITAIRRNGTATPAKARPVIQAARNLPSTISVVVASVTCTGARVE